MFLKQYRYNFPNKKHLLFFTLVFFAFTFSIGQTTQEPIWSQSSSPIYSNLKDLFLFPNYTGVASGDQIIYLNKNIWRKMKIQPPRQVSFMYAIDTNSIYISSKTKFQDSEMFYWNGNLWKGVNHPLNSISTMYFADQNNGVIAGLGEIAILKNKKWKILSPPTIKGIKSVKIDQKGILWAASPTGSLYKYDGLWQKINNSNNISQLELFNNNIYVLGFDYLGIVRSDSIYKISTYKELAQINSFIILDETTFIGVGNNGLIIKYKNDKWEHIHSSVKTNLNSIGMIHENEEWCLGSDGTILHYSKQKEQNFNTEEWKGFDKTTFYAYAKVIDDEYGVVVADFDQDGLPDIFTCGLFESNHLYINQGNNQFIDKSSLKGLIKNKGESDLHLGACAGDLDNDGDLDLYITSLNGKNKIFQNMGKRGFIDYSSISRGIGETHDRTNTSIFGDVDNDGDLDIFITNEYSTNRLYLNNGVGIFKEITKTAGLTTNNGGMGCSFGDIDGDGDLDLFVSNWSKKNLLYKNLLVETGKLSFENITNKSGVEGNDFDKSNGVVFNDIDNDGDLDLLVTNRKTSNMLYINNGKGVFIDQTVPLIGKDSLKSYGVVIADFNGDLQKDIYISNVGSNTFYLNNQNKFELQTGKYGVKIDGYSTGSAVGDFDNDGDLDIYVANYIGEGSVLLTNKLNNNKFVKIQIIGIKNNRSGIGAKLSIYTDGGMDNMVELLHYSEVSGGSGYASMNELIKTIQVKDNAFVDIKVVFPKGEIKKLSHVKTDDTILIYDAEGFKKRILLTKLFLMKRLLDPHKLFELTKWFFVLILIGFSLFYKKKLRNKVLLKNILLTFGLLLVYYLQYYYFEYKNVVLSTLLPLASIILTLTLIHLYNERERIKHVSVIEQEQIRLKLSRDLHDDLASTVSTIGIYLTLIKYKIDKGELKLHQLIEKSEDLVNETTSSITDLIWAINPRPESIDNLVLRFSKNFKELFNEKNVTFEIINNLDENYILQPKIKQNVYLILKEALNNILKYANPNKVTLKAEINQ
ncbi:MAG: VCBS repeat-containing protein, partial [Flavobacteriaceae bacterium]|nr:VCBS repeat-containing protein [Flavobacteriaceae bacterium]